MSRKIAYCTPSLYIAGGVERVLTTKVNWLVENTDWEVYIILTDGKGKDPYYPISSKVKIINLDINFEELWKMSFVKKGIVYLQKQRVFKKLLSKTLINIRPDITVSLLRREINFITNIKDGSQKWGELHINRSHYRNFEAGNTNIIKKAFSKYWMSSLVSKLKRLDRFIVLTEEDKKSWTELDNVIAIPNPLPFWSEEQTTLQNKRIIAVGRYSHEKGYDDLIKAFRIVHQKHPDWKLYIFGSGDSRPYQELANQMGISKACHLLEATKNIVEEYCNSSLFVLSSRFEGFGMVLIEAMNCGLPVVSYACPTGPLQIIKHGENGLLAENGNSDDLAQKICEVIEDRDLMQRLSNEGYNTSRNYSVDNIMKKWEHLMTRI